MRFSLFLLPLLFLFADISAQNPTPEERRSAIRDSLRQERLKRRQQQNTEIQTPTKNKGSDKTLQESGTPSAPIQETTGPSAMEAVTEVEEESVSSGEPVELPISDSLILESLTLRDTEIRDVFSGIASQFKLNIILAPDVSGPISVNLSKIPVKKAIQLIASENGYELTVSFGAIKVGKKKVKVKAPPVPKLVVEYKDEKLTLDAQGVSVERVVRKLIDATGKTIVVERGAKGDITAYYKEIVFEKAFKLMAESNGFRFRNKEGIWSLYKDDWVASAGDAGASETGRRGDVYVKNNKISLDVNNVALQNVIHSIASQSGISTVIYGQLTGNVTAKISEVPITEALQYLFRGTDFTFWLQNGIYFIGSKEMKTITNSKLIVLESMKADEIMQLIPPEVIKDMIVKVVPSQNAIMCMGTYESITMLEDYVSKIDLPVAQILIEALVVDIDMDKIRNFGVDLFIGNAKNTGPEKIYPEFQMTLNKKASEGILSGIPGVRDIVSLPKNFVARVEALEKEKVLNIKSRPQIATLNGKTASITVGQTQYFLLKSEVDYNQTNNLTTKTQEKFEQIQADVTMTVTPFVTGRGEITVEITPDFSEPEGTFNSQVPPTINRRHLKSTVRLREGETIILGGLVKESLNSDRRQFPLLGSIPILGWLFKNHNTTRSKTQLMIFVTPHIYYGKDAHVDPDKFMKELD